MFFETQNKKDENLEFGGNNNILDKCLFILKIEDVNNELKIILSSGIEGENRNKFDIESNALFNEILKDSTPIYSNESDLYEIIFPNYIIYQVRNESYCSWDDYDIRKGIRLYIYEQSKFLEYFKSVTDCFESEDGNYFPAKWIHYGIDGEDHVIDIISHEKPIIKKYKNNN